MVRRCVLPSGELNIWNGFNETWIYDGQPISQDDNVVISSCFAFFSQLPHPVTPKLYLFLGKDVVHRSAPKFQKLEEPALFGFPRNDIAVFLQCFQKRGRIREQGSDMSASEH